MRLIDADRLSEAIYDNVPAPYEDASWAKENCLAEIDAAPTVDAVPVVRCKDCKHSDDECHKDNLRYCMRGIRADDYNETGYIYPVEEVVRDDDFCSYGERKEGAD